jgi:hypothetical protein
MQETCEGGESEPLFLILNNTSWLSEIHDAGHGSQEVNGVIQCEINCNI